MRLAKEILIYNRVTIPFIRMSTLAESAATLSWLAEMLEKEKGLIFELHTRGYERHLMYFIIQQGNSFSIIISLLTKQSWYQFYMLE